ncbi:centrosomin-like isoform X2 [Ischnura elegans]|uniref:centrosomin-like isoform X2 n=1 Tax=Ischnura elegans TaxID=197161 RepID=UPI001ED86E46|nr:centrosomin-like isoform X2 [Ischnura elegans]
MSSCIKTSCASIEEAGRSVRLPGNELFHCLLFVTSPSFLHEVTSDSLSSSGDAGAGPTMKDYETQLNQLKKENFNLKLRIYFLEERLGPYRGEKEDPFQKNIELKVEAETLRKELADNKQLLRDAARAMDQLERQHNEAIQKLLEEQKAEKSRLHLEIEKIKKEKEEPMEKPNHENSAAMYAFAFGMPELLKTNSAVDKEAEERLKEKIKELEAMVESLQNQLKQEKIECKQLEVELTNTKTEKEELDHEVERFGNQLEQMKEKLDEKDHELEESRKQVHNLEEALMAKEPEIRIKVQELAERDRMIDEANSKLEAKEKVLVEIQITLDEKQKQIEALRASLAAKDEALAGLRSKLATSESTVQEYQKMKFDGMPPTQKQMLQFEKNVMKRRPTTFRNHNRSVPESPPSGGSNPLKRPGTAPLPGRTLEIDEETISRLQEEVEKWKKAAKEAKNDEAAVRLQEEIEKWKRKAKEAKEEKEKAMKEVQQKLELVKSKAADEEKVKRVLQAVTLRSKEFEREVEKCKQELRRKEKKIRDLLCELTVAHDQVNKAKWEKANGVDAGREHGINLGFSAGLDEVKDMADEETERLWAELDDKSQKLKRVTEEKNAIAEEFNKKVESLMSMLTEKEKGLAVLEERNNCLMLQLADKDERVKTLESQAQAVTMESLANQRRQSRVSSISEWISQQKILNSSAIKEVFSIRLSSASEDHSFLHSHIQKLQRTLRNTPERERGPKGPAEEVEEAKHEAEEVCALLGGHLWELAVFLEGLLEETNLSLSESHKTSLRRALEWSRELSLSVLSTTGLADQSDRNCTRTSLAVLRDFPSFCACIEAAGESLKESSKKCDEETVHIEEVIDSPSQEVAEPKKDSASVCCADTFPPCADANVSVESLHSSVEALHSRVRELEREVGGKTVDLREGSSEMGRGCNSGESVKTVKDARPNTLNLPVVNGTVSFIGSKQDACVDGSLVNGMIASPSESEGWSEPDRSVSLARMGLEELARSATSVTVASAAQQSTAESGGSVVETRTPSKRSHGEVRRLQNRLRGLEQVIEALRAELRVYHSVAPVNHLPVIEGLQETPRQTNVALEYGQGDQGGPCTRDAEVNTTMGVQSEPVDTGSLGHLLDEVRCQRDKLEISLKQNELIGQQLETVLSGLKGHQVEDGMANLCRKLKDSMDRLEEERARCRDLQSQLIAAKSSLLALETKLQESKDVEAKLRETLKEKEAQLQSLANAGTAQEINKWDGVKLFNGGPKKEAYSWKKDSGKYFFEEKGRCVKSANVSPTKSDVDFGNMVFRSFDAECVSPRRSPKLREDVGFESQNWHYMPNGSSKFSPYPEGHSTKVSKEQSEMQKSNVLAAKIPENRIKSSDISVQTSRLSLEQTLSAEITIKMEREMSQLCQSLREAQERISVEELRARKAEEEVQHWMKVAKEQERIAKFPSAVVHTSEDPSEGSSSSALSGILTDLTRQHSEMSDYVSDQTGGEDSEPSLPQSPCKKRGSRGRPESIPLGVSGCGTYLSPPADIPLTSRQDAFSSPDLGIESDPGRFSSLENPPKTPEEIRLSAIRFSEMYSSGKTLQFCEKSDVSAKLQGSRLLSRCGKSADDLVSASCLNDLRLENEHLKQCLAETRKNLDSTMSKLEAANRRKLHIEKAICSQLQKTHHILRKARVNLGAEIRE